jgi:hypothetical protein
MSFTLNFETSACLCVHAGFEISTTYGGKRK